MRRASLALALSLGLPLLILLGLILALLRSAAWVEHSDEVLARTHQIDTTITSLQTSFRGYRLADEETYLDDFARWRRTLSPQLDELTGLVRDNSRQAAEVVNLRGRIDDWLAFVDAEIARVRGHSELVRDPEFLRRGIPIFTKAKSVLERIFNEEVSLRQDRDRMLKSAVIALFVALGVAAVAGIPLLTKWLQRLLGEVSRSYRESVKVAERRAKEVAVTMHSIGDAVVTTNAEGKVDFLNPAAEELTGWSSAEAHGHALAEVFDIFNEKTRQPAENPVERVLRENRIVGLANHTVLRARGGREVPIEDSAAPIRNEQGEVLGVILVFHDVTEKRAAERQLHGSESRLRFLNALGDATRSLTEPAEIMAITTTLLGEHLRASRCAYAEVESDDENFTILKDYTDGCASTSGRYQLSQFGPKTVAELSAGRSLIIRDLEAEISPGEGRESFAALAVRAIVCHPLLKEENLRAMMAVHQTAPRDWQPEEIALVDEVAERCWATIERARAEAETLERARLSDLRADIAVQFESGSSLAATLQGCTELLVRHLDAAFARIWELGATGDVLELRASAGLYSHIDGPHGRVRVGEFKIGRIARDRLPLLTNDVQHDPNIGDPEWARREAMIAFAGFPLIVEGKLVGVMAVFSRQVFSEAVLRDLAPNADAVAQHIQRKRTEAALQAAKLEAETAASAVAESAERFRLLAEVISLQVWTADAAGGLDFANAECAGYFGVDTEREILGSRWTQYVHPEDLPAAAVAWQQSVATGQRYQVEFRLRNTKDEYRWFLVRAEAMRDGEGRVTRWFGTNTDIDELKTAQREADRASRAKDNFLAVLSHELRTPLTPVLMTAAALRDDDRLPEDVRTQLGMMERNIGLEARLIDDLLDLTRIAKGKLPLRPQLCDAHSLIGLAVEIVRDEAQTKGIAMAQSYEAQRSGLMADPSRFQQVIWNLLRNAVKFTPAGGNVTIATRNYPDEAGAQWFSIEVRDSGIGIEPEAIDRIFQPFEQAGNAGDHRFGGIGLGLAIAQAIVDLHGGSIRAESEGPGRGAVFIVTLPGATEPPAGLIDVADPADTFLHGATATAPEASRQPALRLLLVEDHEPTLQVLTRLLTRAGHQIVSTSSVAAALAAAAKNSFDLVISDLGLPDGTGNALMEQLRDRYQLRGVALTGYGMEEDLERSRQAGFITHLIKPVDFNQLRRVLVSFQTDQL